MRAVRIARRLPRQHCSIPEKNSNENDCEGPGGASVSTWQTQKTSKQQQPQQLTWPVLVTSKKTKEENCSDSGQQIPNAA